MAGDRLRPAPTRRPPPTRGNPSTAPWSGGTEHLSSPTSQRPRHTGGYSSIGMANVAITPLSIHDPAALADYFDRAVKPSKWRTGFKSIDSIAKLDVAIDVGPVKVHRLTELVRDLTLETRLNFATLNWLRPRQPTIKLNELAGLRELAGLDHLHAADLAARLIDRSTELMRQHPQLARWILHRSAALEFVARPPAASVPEELVDSELQLRHAMMRANLLARSSRGVATNAAARGCGSSCRLRGISSTVLVAVVIERYRRSPRYSRAGA